MNNDLIKKEEAKEAVCKGCLKDWGTCHHHWDCPMLTNLEMLLTADRPQGEWISKHNGYWTCSECGLSFLFYAKGNYCPNCGAHMKGVDDETD